MTRNTWLVLMVAVGALAGGCSSDPARILSSDLHAAQPVASAMSSVTVGPDGGTVTSGNTQLVIPAGALSESVEITLVTGQVNGLEYCQVYPAGLALRVPATVSMPLPAAATAGQVYRVIAMIGGVPTDLGGVCGGGRILAKAPQFTRMDEDLIQ